MECVLPRLAFAAPLALAACLGGGGSGGAAPAARAVGEQPVIAAHLSQPDLEAGRVPLEQILEHGRRLFAASFNTLDGQGRPESTGTGAPRPRRTAPQNFNRVSAPDANSCAGCHNVPRPGGGGDNVANVFVLGQRFPFVNFDEGPGDNFEEHFLDDVANERNTLGMFGSGFIELLAREMTADLHAIRDDALAQAAAGGAPVTLSLDSKGVNFGSITANPDGTLDTGAVEGVDADLVIKPFHQKGVVVSLREFTNNAMNHHHGMQSAERFGAGADPDADGHADELTAGDITAVSLWQATLPAPGRVLPVNGPRGNALAEVARGEALFGTIGCADCHVPELRLESALFSEPNPYNPAGNLRPADVTAPVAVDLTADGPGPHLPREADGSVIVRAFTDLKRHDMGPDLEEPLAQAGVPGNLFLTRKLWGMSNEPPFMHHGRALTIGEAILMHGGEGQAARDAYAALATADQDAIIAFLKTLQVLPENAQSNTIAGEFSGILGDEPALAGGHVSQDDIDAGLYTADSLIAIGGEMFAASFNTLDGAGRPETTGTGAVRNRREAPQNFNRVSAPDANSCAGCHNVPRRGGGGDNVANVFVLGQEFPFINFDGLEGDNFMDLHLDDCANERNTLGMFGSGFIELLAREMSFDLQAIRDQAIADAVASGAPVTRSLDTKGVNFGVITGRPDGTADTSGVEGVDADLVVKPFHQKGVVASLRVFTNNAMNHHHGMQSAERFGAGADVDNDGMSDELVPGDITAVTLWQATLPVPGRVLPRDPARRRAVAEGRAAFERAGCAVCHVPALRLEDPVFTEPGPFNPAGNLQLGDVPAPFAVDLTVSGPGPRLPREADGSVLVPAFTDLKRHDLGSGLIEPRVQAGVAGNLFITRKLWGGANEPPFMHHGRATTLTEAILMHGGEAESSRQAFEALSAAERAAVIDFLKTLQVLPENSPAVVFE